MTDREKMEKIIKQGNCEGIVCSNCPLYPLHSTGDKYEHDGLRDCVEPAKLWLKEHPKEIDMKLEKDKKYKINLSMYVGTEREKMSRKVQEKLFAMGYDWGYCSDEIAYTDKPYLFIGSDSTLGYVDCYSSKYYYNHTATEITIDDLLAWQPTYGEKVTVWDDDGLIETGTYIFVAMNPIESIYMYIVVDDDGEVTSWQHCKQLPKISPKKQKLMDEIAKLEASQCITKSKLERMWKELEGMA